MTALYLAVDMKNIEIIKFLLLNNKVNVNILNILSISYFI